MTNRALVVIDVQQEYFTGRLPVSFPDPAASLANIGRAMDAATAAGVPVVVIQQDSPADAPIFAVGSDGWQLHEAVASRHHDALFHKQLPGAFTGTGLEAWLREREIDTVGIVGYMTNMCVDTTTRQAAHLGWHVEVLADATGTLAYGNEAGQATAEQVHTTTLTVLHSVLAAVAPTDTWIAALGGDPLVGSNLVASTAHAVAAD